MIKKLSFVLTALLLFSICCRAQDTSNLGTHCGLNGAYMSTLGIDVNNPNIPAGFPSSAILSCGKFSIYYYDMAYRPGQGFADASVGATRRNTLCAVLTYIQQTFDFSNIPAGQTIRLKVDSSYTAAYRTPDRKILTWGAPYFKLPMLSGSIVNGFVWDYVKSSPAADPAPGSFHGTIRVNFDTYTTLFRWTIAPYLSGELDWPVDFQNGLGAVDHCQLDLFSHLLHATTHTLGFYSMRDIVHGGTWTSSAYTSLDTSIYTGTDPTYSATAYTAPLTKFYPSGASSGMEWFGNYRAPYRMQGRGSHSSEEFDPGRLSHGDYTNPLMSWSFREAQVSRSYGKEELRILHDLIGYNFNSSSFSSSSTEALHYANRRPWCSKNYSYRYSKDRYHGFYYSDTIIADFNLVNNTAASLTININSDTSLHDDDGDIMSIIPESLVNFSGCGQGGNNHKLLSLSNGNKTITFTPRANFIGRAIFGFNLTDGKEKGTFVTYVVNVTRGNNVSVGFGDNLVLNGDFEEGSEVKLKDTAELVNATLFAFGSGGRFRDGRNSSDCHPYNPGVAIRGSYADCSETSTVPYTFGHLFHHFPWAWDSIYLDPVNTMRYPEAYLGQGNRIQVSQQASMYNLGDSLRPCHSYVLEFDAIRSGRRTLGSKSLYPDYEVFDIGFTDATHKASFYPLNVDRNFSLPKVRDSSINFKNWSHIRIPFTYCGELPSDILYLRFHEWEIPTWAAPIQDPNYLLDNVSIKEQFFAVSVRDSLISSCTRRLMASMNSINTCGPSGFVYSWREAGGPVLSSSPVIDVSPLVATTYVLSVSNGCTTAYDTIIIQGMTPCYCSPAKVFGRSASTPLSGVLTTSLASGIYHVTGNLTIGSDLAFTSAKMLIEPGVTITVPSSVKLTIDSSHLFTCPDTPAMWKGIWMESATNSSGRIEVRNNSLIEDAEVAISAHYLKAPPSGYIISIDNSTFNRNGIGVSTFNAYSMGSAGTYPIRISSSLFTSRRLDWTSLPGYPFRWAGTSWMKDELTGVADTRAPYRINRDYDKAYTKTKKPALIGIEMQSIGTTFGGGSSYAEVEIGTGGQGSFNLIDNMQTGLQSRNSNMSVINTHIINMYKRMVPDDTTSYPTGEGWGIVARTDWSAIYRIRTGALGFPVKLYDCFRAIHIENMADADIQQADISSSHKLGGMVVPGAASSTELYAGEGIRFNGNNNHIRWNASYNKISNIHSGFAFFINNPKMNATTTMTYNNLSARNPDGRFSGLTSLQYMMQAVDVYATWAPYGRNTLDISNNTFTEVFNGIHTLCLWSTTPQIANNQISLADKTAATGAEQFGISIENSDDVMVRSNTLNMTSGTLSGTADKIKGVYAALSPTTTVCANSATNIGRSFEFAQLTPQPGTIWAGNTMQNAWKGFTLGSPIGDQVVASGTNRPAGNQWLGSGWGLSRPHTFATVPSTSSKLYVRGGAENPTTNQGFPTTLAYILGSSVFTLSSSVYNCSTGAFPLVENQSLIPAILSDTFDSSIPPVNSWMAQYSLYRMGMMDSLLRDSIPALNTFMTAATNSRYAWLSELETALVSGNQVQAQSLFNNPVPAMGRVPVGNSSVVVNDVSDADYIVGNYLTYFDIYSRFLDSTVNSADTLELETLAAKCPAIDGGAVYQARGLLRLLTGLITEYNDDSCRENSGLYRVTPEGVEEGGQAYSLFPNPNQGSFTIRQNVAENRSVHLKIYNALGMEVYQSYSTFRAGELDIAIGRKIPGVYLICIDDVKGKNTCLRFIIK